MIEIMQRELLTLTDEIIGNINEGEKSYEVDREEYHVEFKIKVEYNVTERQFDRDSEPEQTHTRDHTGCTGRITFYDDGTEISKSDWEDLTEWMDNEITHYEL